MSKNRNVIKFGLTWGSIMPSWFNFIFGEFQISLISLQVSKSHLQWWRENDVGLSKKCARSKSVEGSILLHRRTIHDQQSGNFKNKSVIL
jgi:hypothetical protein